MSRSSSMVGAEETLRRIKHHIMDDRVGVIGIYGMGGVGKTALLKVINNEFLQEEGKDKFDTVIWVTVPKDANIFHIQKAIGDQMGLSLRRKLRHTLYRQLSGKRFILLLDDVWEKPDFMNIGIPLPKLAKVNCKILFTTRSKLVCLHVGADVVVHVGLLDDRSSWKLFQSRLGEAAALINKPGIQHLAKKVAANCGGLPISLITIATAMVKAKSLHEWQDALEMLEYAAAKVSGMEQVLSSLKCSFDMLKSKVLRSCLLYCALFPKDHTIPRERIIDYWVCEGFLDDEDCDKYDLDRSRAEGHAVINELHDACLLEDDGESVKLHDAIRDMALWIAEQEFMVRAGNNTRTRVPHLKAWESAQRISLASNSQIEVPLSCIPICPKLTTLLLQHSKVGGSVPEGFFAHMFALRVLNLEGTSLKVFPFEITGLAQLQHLNLTATDFTSLPRALGNLSNLRQLMLEKTRRLTSIPRKAISGLKCLQVLNMRSSRYVLGCEARHLQLELCDLGNLERLRELALPIHSWPSSLERLNYSYSPSRPITSNWLALAELRRLELSDDPKQPLEGKLEFCPNQFPKLEMLSILSFTRARISVLDHNSPCSPRGGLVFPKLRHLLIDGGHELSELKWVCRLPCLEKFRLRRRDRW